MNPPTPTPPIPTPTPGFGYSLAVPAQDNNGWTLDNPLGPGTPIYVSASRGNDAHNGSTPALAVRTWARVGAILTAFGNGCRHVYARRGDTWSEALPKWNWSGVSKASPLIITTYGKGPRPILKTGANPGIDIEGGGGAPPSIQHVWFLGLDFYSSQRDPSSGNPDYIGDTAAAALVVAGILVLLPTTDLHIEDCRFRYFKDNLSIAPIGAPGAGSDVRIRRNQSTNAWFGVGAHSQGLYLSNCKDVLIEGNALDHNGWNDIAAGGERTIFNHGIYVSDTSNLTIAGNTITNSSSLGIKYASDDGSLHSSLLIQGNLIVGSPNGFAIGATQNYGVSKIQVQGNVLTEIGGTIDGVSQKIAMSFNGVDSTTVTGNVLSNSPLVTGNNNWLYFGDPHPAFSFANRNVSITGNTLHNWASPTVEDQSVGSTNIVIAPNDINLADATYICPNRTLAGYDMTWGGDHTTADFVARAVSQRYAACDTIWTGGCAISYLTIGFIKAATAASSRTISPTGTVTHAFTPTMVQSKVNGVVFLNGTVPTLGSPTGYIRTLDNPNPLSPGSLVSATLYPWGAAGVVIKQVYQNCTAVLEAWASTEDIKWRPYVANPSGSLNINVGKWQMPALTLKQAATGNIGGTGGTDAHQEPQSWWLPDGADGPAPGGGPARGGLDYFSPSNTTVASRYRGWYLADGNGSKGIGFCARVTRTSKSAMVLSSDATSLTRSVTWLEVLNATPGTTRGAVLVTRISPNADKFHLMQPYADAYTNALGMTYFPDQTPSLCRVAADPAHANPSTNVYGYLDVRLDTDAGRDQVIAYAQSVSGLVCGASVYYLEAWGGVDPAYPWLFDPNFIENLLPGSGTPQAARVPAIVAGIVAAGLLPGIASRPGDKRSTDPTKAPVRNSYATTTDTDAQVARALQMVQQGILATYADSVAQGSNDTIPVGAFRAAVGADVPIAVEFGDDGVWCDALQYLQLQWVSGAYQFSNGSFTSYDLQKLRWMMPQATVTAILSGQPLASDLAFMAANKITPQLQDFSASTAVAAINSTLAPLIDPVTRLWK